MRKVQALYSLAMDTLAEIFEEHAYFVDSISYSFFSYVLVLLVDENRQVNVSALNLLKVIIFNSMPACDELIEKYSVLEYLFERLMIEKQLPQNDPFSNRSIDQCTNILCDLLLTRNSKIKKIMYKHHIWQFIFEQISESSKLFHTVIIFKYFFSCFGRREREQVLPSFLEAVANLSLDNNFITEIKEIR
jgi:hypothetical protein